MMEAEQSLVVYGLPFIICGHSGPLVSQYSELGRPLHQYGLYKSTQNIRPMFQHRGILLQKL